MFDTMTFTKIVGGLCGALLVFLLGKWAAELIYHGPGGHGEDHAQGYVIDTGSEGSEEGAEGESGPSFAELFVSADTGRGERVFNKCKACHSVEEGANGTGPYLHGVVGRDVATVDGFSYSGNLVAAADVWTPENLSAFLENPSGYAPGTTMGFAGLGSIEDRANVIAYLDQTDGDTYEMEVPEEEASDEGTEEASAEGEAAEEGASDEGAAEGEAAEGEAAEEGATDEGAAAEEGAADEGAAEGEAAEEGAAEGEAAEEGAADEGAAAEEEGAEADAPTVSAEQVTAEEPEEADVSPTPSAEADAASVTENGDAVLVDEGAETTTEETEGAEDTSGDAAEEGSEDPADEGAAEEEEASAEESGFAAMVASADPAEGEKVFRKCRACHVVDSEQNRVGPHLVDLVGRDVASVEGFRYSNAMQELGGQWTEDRLNQWLEDSKEMAPGNKMAFAGLRDEEDRAAVIAYIESAGN